LHLNASSIIAFIAWLSSGDDGAPWKDNRDRGKKITFLINKKLGQIKFEIEEMKLPEKPEITVESGSASIIH